MLDANQKYKCLLTLKGDMPTTKKQMSNVYYRNQVLFVIQNMKEVIMFHKDFEKFSGFYKIKTYNILKRLIKCKVLKRTNAKAVRIRRMKDKYLRVSGYIYYINPDDGGKSVKKFLAENINLFPEEIQNSIVEAVQDYEWGFDPIATEGFVQAFAERRIRESYFFG